MAFLQLREYFSLKNHEKFPKDDIVVSIQLRPGTSLWPYNFAAVDDCVFKFLTDPNRQNAVCNPCKPLQVFTEDLHKTESQICRGARKARLLQYCPLFGRPRENRVLVPL